MLKTTEDVHMSVFQISVVEMNFQCCINTKIKHKRGNSIKAQLMNSSDVRLFHGEINTKPIYLPN